MLFRIGIFKYSEDVLYNIKINDKSYLLFGDRSARNLHSGR